MTKKILSTAYSDVRKPIKVIILLLVGIIFSVLYPSEIESYPVLPARASPSASVALTEHYVRYVPTAVQIAAPLILRDQIGLVQLLYVGMANTTATQGMKYLLNDRWVMHTRLGQRPGSSTSKHNMPSGHSSMASCAVYFVGRRYSILLGILLAIILLMTMYARVALNAHTISAVIAGALIGLLTAALFTSPWRKTEPLDLAEDGVSTRPVDSVA
jgi:membrane-associated phospholipid phosphatase